MSDTREHAAGGNFSAIRRLPSGKQFVV